MSEQAIEVTGIHKSYRGAKAVNGLDLKVPRGSIFGFLGRNGAGKTTSIRMLLGMARADQGVGRVLGYDISREDESVEIRKRTAFVGENKDLFPSMTAAQMIRFTRGFFPGWREDTEKALLKMFELPLNQRVLRLSKGMRTKLALVLALSRGAELLILDEPTEGLDPSAVEDVLQILVRMTAEQGTTLFFSSHQLHEVEQIADRVALLEAGKVLLAGELDELKASFHRVQLVFDGAVPDAVMGASGVWRARKEGRTAMLLVRGEPGEVIDHARMAEARAIDVTPMNLKEIFLESVKGN